MSEKYDLIALDMDDTLLKSDKTVSDETIDIFKKVRKAGKYVVICTGRPLSELSPYKETFKDLHYYILESGALVYNNFSRKITARHTMDANAVRQIIDVFNKEDMMVQIMIDGQSVVDREKVPRMAHFSMAPYVSLYTETAKLVDDVVPVIKEHLSDIEKMNLYHTSREASVRTSDRLAEKNLPIERIYAELASLELSPNGVHKGVGLRDLAAHLGIPIERTIAVGDADNDIPMLEAAGLSLAVANANDHAKAAADEVLPYDQNHDACRYAIEKYIL